MIERTFRFLDRPALERMYAVPGLYITCGQLAGTTNIVEIDDAGIGHLVHRRTLERVRELPRDGWHDAPMEILGPFKRITPARHVGEVVGWEKRGFAQVPVIHWAQSYIVPLGTRLYLESPRTDYSATLALALYPFVGRSSSDETITITIKTADIERARSALAEWSNR